MTNSRLQELGSSATYAVNKMSRNLFTNWAQNRSIVGWTYYETNNQLLLRYNLIHLGNFCVLAKILTVKEYHIQFRI